MYVFTPNKIHLMQKGADLFGEVDGFKIRVSMPNQYHKHAVFIDDVQFSLNGHETLKETLGKVDFYLEKAQSLNLPIYPSHERVASEWVDILRRRDAPSIENLKLEFEALKAEQAERDKLEERFLGYSVLERAYRVRYCSVYEQFCERMNKVSQTARLRWYAEDIKKLSDEFLTSLHALMVTDALRSDVEIYGTITAKQIRIVDQKSKLARVTLGHMVLATFVRNRFYKLEKYHMQELRPKDVIDISNGNGAIVERVTGKTRRQAWGRYVGSDFEVVGNQFKIPGNTTGYRVVTDLVPLLKRLYRLKIISTPEVSA
jgi:hypothetical protein